MVNELIVSVVIETNTCIGYRQARGNNKLLVARSWASVRLMVAWSRQEFVCLPKGADAQNETDGRTHKQNQNKAGFLAPPRRPAAVLNFRARPGRRLLVGQQRKLGYCR